MYGNNSLQELTVPSLNGLQIRYASTREEAEFGRDRGYEPIECSFGDCSVIGRLGLDHHGIFSHEEPVSLKAVRLVMEQGGRDRIDESKSTNFEAVANSFQFAGMADADAVYAALVLSRVVRPSWELGKAIGELDVDPIGIDRRREPYVRSAAFDMYGVPPQDLEGFRQALENGARVFGPEQLGRDLYEQACAFESDRIRRVREAVVDYRGEAQLVISDEPGRDIWHQAAPIVVQYKPTLKVITLSGCTRVGAQRLGTKSVFDILGEQGLRALYGELDKTIVAIGSGGRPDIGGSPRGRVTMRWEAEWVYQAVQDFLIKHGA